MLSDVLMSGPVAELSHWQQWAYVERFRDHVRRLGVSVPLQPNQPTPALNGFQREFADLMELDRSTWVRCCVQ